MTNTLTNSTLADYIATMPKNLLGDFRIDDVYVRATRREEGDEAVRSYTIARTRKGLDTGPTFDDTELWLLRQTISVVGYIVHVCVGTDDVQNDQLAEWFMGDSVEWLT